MISKRTRKAKKRERSLANKRCKAVAALVSKTNWEPTDKCITEGPGYNDATIIREAYQFFGRDLGDFKKSTPAFHCRYDAIIKWCNGSSPVKTKRKKKNGSPTNEILKQFYQSYDWRKIRYTVLEKYGPVCMCCGWMRSDGIKIHVDHIKPLRFNWDLRLEFDNLQVLCELCNHGKSSWDSTDWRPKING